MLQKFILIVLLSFYFQAKSQTSPENEEIEDNSISNQLYAKCFENLNQGSEILEKYPAFKNTKICSLMYCIVLLHYTEKEIQLIGEQRLQGIATQLFQEGNPVYLISGMDSYSRAENENKNLEDDNHIVYISIAACMISSHEARAQEIVNKQTMLLINKK
ncbi:hypothetical protein AB9T88_02075 [Flavobacterium sp. LBUM151]|jgi:hypothetical protein